MASLTPRPFQMEASPPTLTFEARFSKHRRKDTLPMHPELVILVRGWIADLAPDDPPFPNLAWRKTHTMVQKDLERSGIPYETPEGLADFHAARRHSHITGLVRSGASSMEAKELAHHVDIRQTARHTHVGMEDRAEAWLLCRSRSHRPRSKRWSTTRTCRPWSPPGWAFLLWLGDRYWP